MHLALLTANADIQQNEELPGTDILCISVITKLEHVLQQFLLQVMRMNSSDLQTILQYHSQALMDHCCQITEESLPALFDRMQHHEADFPFFFMQKHPGMPLPPPEPERAFYSDEIVLKYKHLLDDLPAVTDWPWVSRKHLRLCLYMLEQVRGVLHALLRGDLPVVKQPLSMRELFIQTVELLVEQGVIVYKQEYVFLYKKAEEMQLFRNWTYVECFHLLQMCKLGKLELYSVSSLKRLVIRGTHPHWKVQDMSDQENERFNQIGTHFENIFEGLKNS